GQGVAMASTRSGRASRTAKINRPALVPTPTGKPPESTRRTTRPESRSRTTTLPPYVLITTVCAPTTALVSRIVSRSAVCHCVLPVRTSTSVTVPKWSDTTTSPPAAPGMTPDSNDAGAGTRPAFDAGGEVAGDDARGEVAVALTQHDQAVV